MVSAERESQGLEIWYFCPDYDETTDKKIRKNLEEIKTIHSIDFQLKQAENRAIQERYYKDYFSPSRQAYMLRQRTGLSIEKNLKSRNGKGKPMLRGTIALVEGNNVQYYVTRGGSGKDALNFLKKFFNAPRETLEECYSNADELTDEEMVLLDAFKAQHIINGNYISPYPVGRFFKENFGCKLRFADSICEVKDGNVWVFEVERELNYNAIGQAISYKYLYDKDNPSIRSSAGIICCKIPQGLKEVCENVQISVFLVNKI
jgi:hypothetical protein